MVTGKTPGRTSEVHSVRTPNDIWDKAKRRAQHEGVTMNYVLASILEGYANGLMDLPRVQKHYEPTRTP